MSTRVRALVFVRAHVCACICRRVPVRVSRFIPALRERSWSLLMSAPRPPPYEYVARKWHALAERRLVHVEDLRDSGLWRHYYEWDALIEALGEAVATRDTWAKLAGLAPEEAMGPSGAVAGDTPDDWLEAELFRKAG